MIGQTTFPLGLKSIWSLPPPVITPSSVAAQPAVAPPTLPQLSFERTGAGQAKVKIGNEYEITLNENASELNLKNLKTGNTTKVWGDPHICWDGSGRDNVVTGDGKFTFVLADGRTKITCDTTQWYGDSYLTDSVTIRRNDEMLTISGLGQKKMGDFDVQLVSKGGRNTDRNTSDGFVMYENKNGNGWLDKQGKMIDQRDATDGTYSSSAAYKKTAAAFTEIETVEDVNFAKQQVLQEQVKGMRESLDAMLSRAGLPPDLFASLTGWFSDSTALTVSELVKGNASLGANALAAAVVYSGATAQGEKDTKRKDQNIQAVRALFDTKTFASILPSFVTDRIQRELLIASSALEEAKAGKFGAKSEAIAESMSALIEKLQNRLGLDDRLIGDVQRILSNP
jgi:Domain of Unknown Function (DUF1521)